ncbi:MAG: glycosyltransferase family 4 protein [Kocuria sp.]|nr:glycosyltransferase family 4 protein [Kocuria sp.]
MAVGVPRALWIVPVPEYGGVARHVLDVARVGLPGWDVTVLCPEGELAARLRNQGAHVITGAFGPRAGVLRSARTLRRIVRGLRPQVVHSHLAYADVVAAAVIGGMKIAAVMPGVPPAPALVSTEHGIAPGDTTYRTSVRRARIMNLLHTARLRVTDGAIAVSASTRRLMADTWRARHVRVVRNGVDVASVREAVDRERARTPRARGPRYLTLSRLAPEKRIDAVIRAFAVVAAQEPTAVLRIAGEGPAKDDLVALTQDLGLDRSVDFMRFVEPEHALAWTDVLVQVSEWENCSYTLLDAVAAGVAVVATDVGGNREILDDDALIPPDIVSDASADQGWLLPDALPRTAVSRDDRPASVHEMVSGIVAAYPARSRAEAMTRNRASGRRLFLATNNGDISGGETMLFHMARAARDQGREVVVVAPTFPRDVLDRAVREGFPVHGITARNRVQYMRGLAKFGLTHRLDRIWCNGLVPSFALSGHPRRIVHLHQVPLRIHLPLCAIAKVGATMCLTPSPYMSERVPGSRIFDNWVPEVSCRERRPRADGTIRVGHIGRISPRKGVVTLADACVRLMEEGNDLELHLAGGQRHVRWGEVVAVERALARVPRNRLHRTGNVPVEEFFDRVDLLVCGSELPEAFGLVAAEAMSAGLPVVVSDAGSLPGVVGESHPWIFAAGNVDSLAETLRRAIHALTASDESFPAMIAAGRERWRRKYSPEAAAVRMRQVLDDLDALG